MDINEYINKLWSSLLADDVLSDFGNVTYYGLLKDTLLLFKKLNEEWELKKDGFNEQIDSAVKILNSAIELLNSIDMSVDELNAKYNEFVNTVNTEISQFEKETNSKIEQLSTNIGKTISEYINSPEFKELLIANVNEILQGAGFEELVQNVIAKTTIEFSKVNVSGSNAPGFVRALASNGALLRKTNTDTYRTMEKDLIFNNGKGLVFKDNNSVLTLILYITDGNVIVFGSNRYLMQIYSKTRPYVYADSINQQMAFLSDLDSYINKKTPSIPNTSIFKIGKSEAIQSTSSNGVIFGDYNNGTYLAVKDNNTRPKMRTKSGTSFDLSTKNDVTAEVTKQLNTFVDKIYHVGRIIETIDETFDPNTIIGYWELYGKGKVTICVDKNNSLMNEAGMTLGEAEVTLTVNEMPRHNHAQYVAAKTNPATGIRVDYNEDAPSSAFEQGINTGYAGNGQPHNNMQPSITVYRWIRIS